MKENVQTCTLFLGNSEVAHVNSIEELEETLIEIRRNFKPSAPLFAMLHSNNNCLSLGIAREGCYVNYIDASRDPPYYSSLGDRTMTYKDGVVRFQMSPDNHVSEILRRNIITFEDLLRVAKAFFVTGTRPETLIEWEMD